MDRKISDNPFFVMPLCPSPEHNTIPAQARKTTNVDRTPVDDLEIGLYEHVCPDCGNVTVYSIFGRDDWKIYQESSAAILGGESNCMSKEEALQFLRQQAVVRSGQ
jgi:hypothetical protein